jgi:hypothetical protein
MQRKIRVKNSLKRRFTFLHAVLLLAMLLSLVIPKRGMSTLPVNTSTPGSDIDACYLSHPYQDETRF